MFQRKFEKFNSGQETAIEAACVIVEQMASRTLMPNKPLAIWFGAADRVALTSKLRKMSAVIADSNRTVTFVNRTGGSLGVAHTSIYEKKLLPPDKKENLDGVVAYAHPVDRRDEPGPKKTVSHVGSGMTTHSDGPICIKPQGTGRYRRCHRSLSQSSRIVPRIPWFTERYCR